MANTGYKQQIPRAIAHSINLSPVLRLNGLFDAPEVPVSPQKLSLILLRPGVLVLAG